MSCAACQLGAEVFEAMRDDGWIHRSLPAVRGDATDTARCVWLQELRFEDGRVRFLVEFLAVANPKVDLEFFSGRSCLRYRVTPLGLYASHFEGSESSIYGMMHRLLMPSLPTEAPRESMLEAYARRLVQHRRTS